MLYQFTYHVGLTYVYKMPNIANQLLQYQFLPFLKSQPYMDQIAFHNDEIRLKIIDRYPYQLSGLGLRNWFKCQPGVISATFCYVAQFLELWRMSAQGERGTKQKKCKWYEWFGPSQLEEKYAIFSKVFDIMNNAMILCE